MIKRERGEYFGEMMIWCGIGVLIGSIIQDRYSFNPAWIFLPLVIGGIIIAEQTRANKEDRDGV